MAIDLEQIHSFMTTLFEDIHGLIELRPIEVDGPAHSIFCRNVEESVRAIQREAAPGVNMYCGIATRRTRVSGKKDNLAALRALWVDIDFHEDPQGERELLEITLETFPLPPSLRVWSGGGVHLYWILSEPVRVDTTESIARVEAILKGLADALGGDRAATDASRVLRVPGTTNYPDQRKRDRGRVPAECRIS